MLKSTGNFETVDRVQNLFAIQELFMKIAGQINLAIDFHLPDKLKILGVVASRVYCVFMVFLTLHLAVLFGVTAFNLLNQGHLDDIIDAFTSLIIYAYAAFATVYWICRSKELCIYIKEINGKYEYISLPGLTILHSRPAFELAAKFTKYWQFSGVFSVVFVALTPVLMSQRSLPLKCWYPFDVTKNNTYEFIYLVQFLAHFEMGAVYSNGSALYASFILILLGQYDVLFCSIKNIHTHSRLLTGKNIQSLRKNQWKICTETDEVNQYIICKEQVATIKEYTCNECSTEHEFKLAMRYSIKHCVLHHLFILKSCQELENLFNPFCLVKYMQMTAQLCLLVFVAVMTDISVVRSLNQLCYVILTVIELFIFSFFGELLRSHSQRCGEAIFRSEWITDVKLVKKEILIFLENSKRPVRLTAGKLFVMNIDRLGSVIAQAFSFFTLLQKFAEKKNAK